MKDTQIQIPQNFILTYFADKHDKFIPRRGQFTKPETDKTGKYVLSKDGTPCIINWD